MKPILDVQHITKQFKIGAKQEGYLSLRDFLAHPFRKKDPAANTIQALNDVSFEVYPGESIGIIGRNGAGKSTLLKILSKITPPSAGKIISRGRIASLLEVGTGFHSELTGRENIYMNGSILGMRKAEIDKHFDAIVSFSGVEVFLDTPLKRYSSGMQLRLAFAVAAHLEPEILIIDEVLAVGDAEFQKKCLSKMDDVSKNEGRTVLFVSHQMGTISQLCSKSIMLDKGNLITMGPTAAVIDRYLEQSAAQSENIERAVDFPGNHFQAIHMVNASLDPIVDYGFDEQIRVRVKMVLPENNPALELAMRLIDKHKKAVFTIHEKIDKYLADDQHAEIMISIPAGFLTPGRYSWVMCINHPGAKLYDLQDDVLPFNIIDTGSDFARYEGADYGSVFANYTINRI